MMELGAVAYEGYCRSADNKSLISGITLPPFRDWSDLRPEIQEAWNSAAINVRIHLENRKS